MMRLQRTTVLHFVSQVVVSLAGFASKFAIGLFLGAAVLGQYSVAVALGVFWFPLAGVAIGKATTKRVSEGRDRAAYLAAGFLTNAGVAGLTAVVILAGGTLVGIVAPESSLPFVTILADQKELVAGLAVATIAFQTSMSGLAGQKKVAQQGALTAVERVLRTLAQVALIFFGIGLFGLIVGHVFSLVLVAVIGILIYNVGVRRPGREHFASILRFGQYGWASTFQGRVFGWMDVLVLSLFVTDAQIGIYEAAWGFGSLLATVSVSVESTLFPEISELSADGDLQRIKNILGEGLVFSGIFVIPGLFGAVVIGERVLEIYRPSFGEGSLILVVLVGAYVADVYGSQLVSALNAIDRPELTYRINLLFIGLNLALNVALVWQFGWYGAAAATLLSATFRLGLAYRLFQRVVGRPNVPIRHIGWEFVAAGLMLLVVVPANAAAPAGRFYTVGLVLLGAAVYVLALVALSTLVRRKLRQVVGPLSKPRSS